MILAYILNITLCALLLYAVYALALENERMHRFKRVYLVFSLVFSLTVPLIIMPVSVSKKNSMNINDLYTTLPVLYSDNMSAHETSLVETTVNPGETGKNFDYCLIIKLLYIFIAVCLSIRMIYNLLKMIYSSHNKSKIPYFEVFIIPVSQKIEPYSFYKYLFVSQTDYFNNEIPDEILMHELAHIRQKHFWDILFIETLIVAFWFNPVFYLYRTKIKLNHEFLADEAVLNKNSNIAYYQTLLINSLSKKQTFIFTHNFNFLTTKKRLIMMTAKISPRRVICKKIALVPLFVAAVFVFSAKIAAQNDVSIVTNLSETINESSDSLIIVGKGLSEEKLAEFQKFINEKAEIDQVDSLKKVIKWHSYDLTDDEWKNMYILYIQMNKEQRKKQSLWFDGAFSPTGNFRSPNRDEWRMCKEAQYIWLNGEKSDKQTLESFDRHDIYYFISIRVDDNNREGAVWTKDGYEKYLKKYDGKISEKDLLEIKPRIWHITAIPAK